jgi:hypothetical protein
VNHETNDAESGLLQQVLEISSRLKSDPIVEGVEAITDKIENVDFSILAKSVRESIEKNEPAAVLDRLHTYAFHFVRELCKKHKIEFNKEESLNAVYGKYVKYIVDNKLIETQMTERILKSSISLIEFFNGIRNNKSFAHPNEILNYEESLLIVTNITHSIRFIQSLEVKNDELKRKEARLAEEKNRKDNVGRLTFLANTQK